MIREIKQRICEFVHERNGSKALCKNQIESCLQLIRLCDVVRIMNQVESEYESKTDWIPCEERLPSDTAIHEVTAQFSNGTFYTEFAYYDESREEWWKFDDDGIVNVVAWKEGSQPYKKEGNTNEST